VIKKDWTPELILEELKAIQNTGLVFEVKFNKRGPHFIPFPPSRPRKYAILGTRHGSFMHNQIIELLGYALVLTGNHIFTSG